MYIAVIPNQDAAKFWIYCIFIKFLLNRVPQIVIF